MDLSTVVKLGLDLSSRLLDLPEVAVVQAQRNPSLLEQMGLTESDLDYLDEDTLIALTWRLKWLTTARQSQIPPNTPWREWLLSAGRGFGKELCINTPVPTPSGWTTMGSLRDGDTVFDETGTPCAVLKAHPVTDTSRAYRITFDDGTAIDACEDHQWMTWTHRDRKQYQRYRSPEQKDEFPENWPEFREPIWQGFKGGKRVKGWYGPQVRLTRQILDTLFIGVRQDTNHSIPAIRGLNLPDVALPIQPYTLGYWLANGSRRDSTLSTGSYKGSFDHDHVRSMVVNDGYSIGYDRLLPEKGQGSLAVHGLHRAICSIGMGDKLGKFIPPDYLRASRGQRWALLRGLCDGDGFAETKGVEYCSTERELAEGVLELVRSLGETATMGVGRATLNGKDCGLKYRVLWRPTQGNPFSLPRKVSLIGDRRTQRLRTRHRMIVSIEPIPSKPMRCITVDSPNSMYLVSRAFIPTHNTRIGAEWLGWECWIRPETRAHVVSPTASDLRITAFEGDSGLVNVIPRELVHTYNRSTSEMLLKNGSRILGFSAQEPDRLRGPQCARGWLDELAAFGAHLKDPAAASKAARDTLDMFKFGWRLGKNPQMVYTTTPKPVQHVRDLIKRSESEPGIVLVTRGSTYENKDNLAPTFLEQLSQYEGTSLGRQEIHAEMLNPEESGIIKRSWFKLYPANKPVPRFEFVLSSWDTAFTEKTTNDPTGNIVLGVFADNDGTFNTLLCDAWTLHMTYPDLKQKVIDEYENRYGEGDRKADVFLIEDKGSGISLRQDLASSNIPMVPYNPGRADKTQRLHLISHLIKLGRVWLPESPTRRGEFRDWCLPFVEQVCAFPLVDHDEYVDTLAQALSYLQDSRLLEGTYRKVEEDNEVDYDARKRKYTNPYAI